jgi:peroxiredoxin
MVLSQKAPQYILTGKIRGLQAGTTVYLSFGDREDSVLSEDGFFQFSGLLKEPERVFVMIRNPKLVYKSFWLEHGTIVMEGHRDSLNRSRIYGSATEAMYAELNKIISPKESKIDSLGSLLNKALKTKDEGKTEDIKKKLLKLNDEIKELKVGFIKKHPASYIAAETLYFLKFELGKKELDQLYNGLSKNIKNTKRGKQVAAYLALFSNPQPGKKAPAFAMRDNNDRLVELSQFKGKYVLLEFWANWCAPCLEELPNLLASYELFKDKGFEIIGVSLDNKKEVWLKSIKEHNMKWVNISDLKGGDNKVAIIYGVNGIPDNFLIDPNGIIVDRKLRGEALRKKLEELIK